MTRSRILALAVLLAGMALVPTQQAVAQTDLPPATIRATDLSPDQIGQIQEYVRQQFERLQAENPDAKTTMRAVRDRLLAPLRDREISFRFRQEYSNLIVPQIQAWPQDNELYVVNMLRIAGELATQESTALVEGKLADQSAPVRYAAVAALGRTFDAIQTEPLPKLVPLALRAGLGNEVKTLPS